MAFGSVWLKQLVACAVIITCLCVFFFNVSSLFNRRRNFVGVFFFFEKIHITDQRMVKMCARVNPT
jgi:hypothetical protein